MPKYQRCPPAVKELAADVLNRHQSHKPVLNADVTIDFLFAYPDLDENGMETSPAILHHGSKALGLCRIVNLRDRVKGCADVEITLDASWWDKHDGPEREGLLDHELHHITVVDEETDDIGRPKIKLRKHDVEVGFFHAVAARNGQHSQERIQSAYIMEAYGQFYWPELTPPLVQTEKAAKEFQRLMRDNNAKLTVASH